MKEEHTILLLEDDEVDVIAIKRALKELGIKSKLVVVSNGEEGLKWLAECEPNSPCLILSDINMPLMNGIEFLRRIKSSSIHKKIPVIALTSSREETDRIHAFELGVAGYMVKPVDPAKYLSVMKTICLYWQASELPL